MFRKMEDPENSGLRYISGKITTADGDEYSALLGVSLEDGGELFEAYFRVGGELVSQGDPDFLAILGKREDDIFPYDYRFNKKIEGDLYKSPDANNNDST